MGNQCFIDLKLPKIYFLKLTSNTPPNKFLGSRKTCAKSLKILDSSHHYFLARFFKKSLKIQIFSHKLFGRTNLFFPTAEDSVLSEMTKKLGGCLSVATVRLIP